MTNPNYKCHLFICTNTKEKGSSCGPKSSVQLRLDLKKRMEEKYPDKKHLFRINASGCLSLCEKGINCVSYPSGKWLNGLSYSESDLDKLEAFVLSEIEK
jgi:predicted metal-binding protein